MKRANNIQKLGSESYDVCVIGAGASGAGVALDAALRGMKVALIDRNDFCSETSSKSTKLIHGGVRYLEQAFKNLDFGQLKQVRHGLHERHTIMSNAPHLAKPLALITPVNSWFEGLYYLIGLKLYGLFAAKDTLPAAQWLSKTETLERIPKLSAKLHSSIMYYDGQFDDSRYCLELVKAAAEEGATVANYVNLESFEINHLGQIDKANVVDLETGNNLSIAARKFINCTGPFADAVRLMANPDEEPRMRPSKGVHIVFSNDFVQSKDALLIPKTKDGRVVFMKPIGSEVMVGTTDTAYNDIENEPKLEEEEVAFLQESLTNYLQKVPEQKDIKAGFAGIRPLLAPSGVRARETKSLLRDHEVEVLEHTGLISLLGGKWTTYRVMAKDAVDVVSEQLGFTPDCTTATYKLPGGDFNAADQADFESQCQQIGLAKDTIEHLWANYGKTAFDILEILKEDLSLAQQLVEGYPFIKGEVKYAATQEMSRTIRDFLARRIRLEFMDWKACLSAAPVVATIMAAELHWSDTTKNKNIAAYTELIYDLEQKAGI